jgi:hypothetical protein
MTKISIGTWAFDQVTPALVAIRLLEQSKAHQA